MVQIFLAILWTCNYLAPRLSGLASEWAWSVGMAIKWACLLNNEELLGLHTYLISFKSERVPILEVLVEVSHLRYLDPWF